MSKLNKQDDAEFDSNKLLIICMTF